MINSGNIPPFNALTLLVGRQKGHPARRKVGVGLLVVTLVWSSARLIPPVHHLHHPSLQQNPKWRHSGPG